MLLLIKKRGGGTMYATNDPREMHDIQQAREMYELMQQLQMAGAGMAKAAKEGKPINKIGKMISDDIVRKFNADLSAVYKRADDYLYRCAMEACLPTLLLRSGKTKNLLSVNINNLLYDEQEKPK